REGTIDVLILLIEGTEIEETIDAPIEIHHATVREETETREDTLIEIETVIAKVIDALIDSPIEIPPVITTDALIDSQTETRTATATEEMTDTRIEKPVSAIEEATGT
ncbi:MAG: hypothetical protein MR687_00700, partial [Spirochaetales bacterium]|nr:hypothetical protein [Spirochaetales bacterium]